MLRLGQHIHIAGAGINVHVGQILGMGYARHDPIKGFRRLVIAFQRAAAGRWLVRQEVVAASQNHQAATGQQQSSESSLR